MYLVIKLFTLSYGYETSWFKSWLSNILGLKSRNKKGKTKSEENPHFAF